MALLLICVAWTRWLVVTSVDPLPIGPGADVRFEGVVLERVQRATSTELRMRGWIGDGTASEYTTVLARCRGDLPASVRYGTIATVTGTFDPPREQRNPGRFDYGRA